MPILVHLPIKHQLQQQTIYTIIEDLGPLRIREENASGNKKLYDKSVQNKDTAYRNGSF